MYPARSRVDETGSACFDDVVSLVPLTAITGLDGCDGAEKTLRDCLNATIKVDFQGQSPSSDWGQLDKDLVSRASLFAYGTNLTNHLNNKRREEPTPSLHTSPSPATQPTSGIQAEVITIQRLAIILNELVEEIQGFVLLMIVLQAKLVTRALVGLPTQNHCDSIPSRA
nr:hypothetical protein Iba_chr13bCG5060 [Ipomoea batatas]